MTTNIEITLPIEMTIADRTYEILDVLQRGEKLIVGYDMVTRAEGMQAHLGEEDGQHLLNHQEEIPEIFRGKVSFVFTAWLNPKFPTEPHFASLIFWSNEDDCWVQDYGFLGWDWRDSVRLLRRKQGA